MNEPYTEKLTTMVWYKSTIVALLICLVTLPGCLRYGFTGINIPSEIRTVYIPFFPDQSGSGLGDLSDNLNQALVNRFVNQSRLNLTSNSANADMLLEGEIRDYSNEPFSVADDRRAELNRVTIRVRAEARFADNDSPEWDKTFTGTFEYDPTEAGADGEIDAAFQAMEDLADDMFNDALGDW